MNLQRRDLERKLDLLGVTQVRNLHRRHEGCTADGTRGPGVGPIEPGDDARSAVLMVRMAGQDDGIDEVELADWATLLLRKELEEVDGY